MDQKEAIRETCKRAVECMESETSHFTDKDSVRLRKFSTADDEAIENIKNSVNFMSFTHTSERCAEWGAMQMLYHKNKQLHDYLSSKLYSIQKRTEECDRDKNREEYCKLLAEADLVKLMISETQ